MSHALFWKFVAPSQLLIECLILTFTTSIQRLLAVGLFGLGSRICPVGSWRVLATKHPSPGE